MASEYFGDNEITKNTKDYLKDLDEYHQNIYYRKTLESNDNQVKSLTTHNKTLRNLIIFFAFVYVLMIIGMRYNIHLHENELLIAKDELLKLKEIHQNSLWQADNNYNDKVNGITKQLKNSKEENAYLKQILIEYLKQDLERTKNKRK